MRTQYIEKCRLYLDDIELDSYVDWDLQTCTGTTVLRDVF